MCARGDGLGRAAGVRGARGETVDLPRIARTKYDTEARFWLTSPQKEKERVRVPSGCDSPFRMAEVGRLVQARLKWAN